MLHSFFSHYSRLLLAEDIVVDRSHIIPFEVGHTPLNLSVRALAIRLNMNEFAI